MIRRANQRFAVIQHYSHNLSLCAGQARVGDSLQPNFAVFADGVTEMLFPFRLFGDDFHEIQSAAIGKSDASITGKAASRAIALHNIQLSLRRVALRAVCQFAGQGQALQRGLADDQVARLARRVARPRRGEALGDDGFRGLRVLFQKSAERLAHHLRNVGLHLGVHQLHLGLRLKLRVRVLDRDDGGQAFARIVAGEVRVGILQQPVLARVVVDDARQRRAQAGHVCAAVHGVDRVGERINRFGERVRVLDGGLDADALDFLLDVNRRV